LNLGFHNADFSEFFEEIFDRMNNKSEWPRFMFLDQYGIKSITKEVFQKLTSLKRTDFLFFISSSYASRFVETESFQKYIKLSREDFDASHKYHCHRKIFDYYKSQIPPDKEFYLSPFSIKKGPNIYGLIFGTNHLLGIEKFLNVAWKLNPKTGDSNFDIDNEHINWSYYFYTDNFLRQKS
jgi:three-Cys-motif partner protein